MPSWGVVRTTSSLNPCDPVAKRIPALSNPLERSEIAGGDDHPFFAVVVCVEDCHRCCCE